MVTPQADWRALLYSYPCPTCGAQPGDPCLTYNRKKAQTPHAARTRHGARCPRCNALIAWDSMPGDLCDHCALIRSLEVERATKHRRQT